MLCVFLLTGAAAEEPKPAAPAPIPEILLLDDELPKGSTQEGTWVWEKGQPSDGKLFHSHPPAKGIRSHGYSLEELVPVTANSMIVQEVWLDPAAPPMGIALQLRLSTGDEVGVYWEGEEEVFKPKQGEELWYYGPMPELGQWAKLEILVEDLGLEEAQVTGIRFVTYDGRALWDRTLLTAAPPIEEAETALDPAQVRPDLGNRTP